MDRELFFILIYWLTLGIIIGWLIPITGPFESSNSEEPLKVTRHSVAAPSPPKKVLIDLNDDGIPEWYLLTASDFNIEEEL